MDKRDSLIKENKTNRPCTPEDHSHEWRGIWKRPMRVDERGLHPFTVARMTDHNVKGRDT
jgi:hypothetical protein